MQTATPPAPAPIPATKPPLPAHETLTGNLTAAFNREPDAAIRAVDMIGAMAVKLTLFLLILGLTFWLSGLASRLIKRAVERYSEGRKVDTTLSNFVGNLTRYIIIIVGLVAAVGQLGVQTTSILAVLGAASLAIGLALQGALSNVAAGVMLLILRPYRINDLVELGGRRGRVRNLDLFVTELTAPDGLRLTMPNAKVLSDMIVNYTASGRRRMELKFGIDYGDDAERALDLLLLCAEKDPRVFKDPAPWAKVTALMDSSVTVTLRAWTSAEDIGDAEADMVKRVKDTFEAEGLHFAYPYQVGLTHEEALAQRKPKAAKPTARAVKATEEAASKPARESTSPDAAAPVSAPAGQTSAGPAASAGPNSSGPGSGN